MNFTVHRFTGDLDVIRELDRECFPEDQPLDTRGIWWVAKTVDGKIAGYACARDSSQGRFLARAGVLPKFRGSKLQRRLIYARTRGYRGHLYTYTSPDNVESMRNLMACGFKPYRPVENWAGHLFVYWWMMKN